MNTIGEWMNLDLSTQISEEVGFINVDTRDFHYYFDVKVPNEYIRDVATKAEDKYLISEKKIIDWILDLKQKTGGDGDWRHIELKTGHGGDRWLKYIWFVRVTWTHFVMMTHTGDLLEMDKILDEIDWSNPYLMAE